ncbi:MAG: sigma-70 family RNA polymerase sigma factor [Firmicutes bacterium]|nr:sigma-70 family RNA polymerase sigma factor [Bacillota bacterium]
MVLPLSAEKQSRDLLLLEKIWAGDEAAKEELGRKYLPMVHHLARGRSGEYLEYEDLCQEGAIGLLHAITEYDPVHYAVKFSTFAYICIMRHLNNAAKRTRTRKGQLLQRLISLHGQTGQHEGRSLLDSLAGREIDPWEIVLEAWAEERIRAVLQAYLSPMEFAVVQLLRQGLAAKEIQRELAMEAKVVDNARTRARLKLLRLLREYGSILHPDIPLVIRKRLDLAIKLEVG